MWRLAWLWLPVFVAVSAGAQQEAAQAALAVELARAEQVSHERVIAADGEVVARELAAVNAQVSGVSLARLNADVGDRVQAGQVLARFDAVLLQQELAQAKAQEVRAEAALSQAKRNAARASRLVRERAVSVSDSEQFSTALREAQAAFDGAVAARKSAQLRLGYAEVRAPVAGVVVSRPAEVGMTAGIGSPLFVLQVDGALEWRAMVSPEDAARLQVGSPVRLRVGAALVAGKVRLFAPVADAASRRVVVFVSLAADAALRANLLLRGEFLLGKEAVWTVPASALVRDDGYVFVMVVDEGNRVRRQPLVPGERLGERVVVREEGKNGEN